MITSVLLFLLNLVVAALMVLKGQTDAAWVPILGMAASLLAIAIKGPWWPEPGRHASLLWYQR